MKKFVATGPESSGKSLLCQQLAVHFNTVWIPEYARIYLEEHGPHYDIKTLKYLISAHLDFQRSLLRNIRAQQVFLDTDLINYRVWSQLVFNTVIPIIDDEISGEQDHLYLLMSPDLAWEADPLRENPGNREHIFDLHLQEIEKRNRPYRIITGTGDQRLTNAIRAVQELSSLHTG